MLTLGVFQFVFEHFQVFVADLSPLLILLLLHLQGLPNNLFKALRSDVAFDVLEKLIDHDVLGVRDGFEVFDLRIELQPILDQRDVVRINTELQL